MPAINLISNVKRKITSEKHTQLSTQRLNVRGRVGHDSNDGLQSTIITTRRDTGGAGGAGGCGGGDSRDGRGCSGNEAGGSQEEGRDEREDAHCERVKRATGVKGLE